MARSGGLEAVNKKLFSGGSTLQATMEQLSSTSTHGPLTVLEIGRGAGRSLFELALAFRRAPARFCAIDLEPGTPCFDERKTSHLADDSIDLIYSCSAARLIDRKAEFVEEVCRLLRPGGLALIQLSKSGWDYPVGPARDDLSVMPHPSRWVLTHRRELVPLPMYLHSFARSGFEFDFVNKPSCVVRIVKRRSGRLALGLEYDEVRSGPMRHLVESGDPVWRGGFRSVYRVSHASYKAMIHNVLESAVEDPPTRREIGVPMVSQRPNDGEPSKRAASLTSYRVGERIKIKGRRGDGRCFHASKIRPNGQDKQCEELEGGIEWVDAPTGTFGLLGCTVWVDAERRATSAWGRVSRGGLTPGTLAKVSGSFRDGRFTPRRLVIKEPQAVIVDEIQGAIEAIDIAGGSLEVAGFTVRVDTQTRLVLD
jgi:SAM-dependent methyltransferase